MKCLLFIEILFMYLRLELIFCSWPSSNFAV